VCVCVREKVHRAKESKAEYSSRWCRGKESCMGYSLFVDFTSN
jgi:hypothetical protein